MGYFKEHKESFSARGEIPSEFLSFILLSQSLPPSCPFDSALLAPPDFSLDWLLVSEREAFIRDCDELLESALEEGKKLLEADQGFLFSRRKGHWVSEFPECRDQKLLQEVERIIEEVTPEKPLLIYGESQILILPIPLGKKPLRAMVFSSSKRNWARERACAALFFSREVNWAFDNLKIEIRRERAVSEAARALWQAVYAKDPGSARHLNRSQRIGEALAKKLGLQYKEKKLLIYSLMLHDIGKIGVPGSVPNKPGPLTEEEWKIVRLHPEIGAKILKPFTTLRSILPVVLHHHERWDGKGYPNGLKNGEIPFLARIVSVVDAFQAMRSDRPYRRALSLREALRELKNGAGTQFDPEVVRTFLSIKGSTLGAEKAG
ncbi:MAG: HD-GYP domain-containing protein [bacterium]